MSEKFAWDINRHLFVKADDNEQQVTRLDWFLRDLVSVELQLVEWSDTNSAYSVIEAPSGWSIKFCIKQSGSLDGAALAFAGTWTKSGSGDDTIYTASVNLNTTALINAVGSLTKLDLIAEFTLQNTSGRHRDTSQLTCRMKPDVYRGTEGTPIDAHWPLLEEYTDGDGNKCVRMKNSDGQTLAVWKPAGV